MEGFRYLSSSQLQGFNKYKVWNELVSFYVSAGSRNVWLFYVQYCAKETSPLAVYIILPAWDKLVKVSQRCFILDCDVLYWTVMFYIGLWCFTSLLGPSDVTPFCSLEKVRHLSESLYNCFIVAVVWLHESAPWHNESAPLSAAPVHRKGMHSVFSTGI